MEELTNNLESIVEVSEPEQTLEVVESVNETVKDESNLVGAIVIGAVVSLGAYGVIKFLKWRKSKKVVEEVTYTEEFEEVVDETEEAIQE